MKKLLLIIASFLYIMNARAQAPDTWSLVGAMPPSPDSARIFATSFSIDTCGYIGLGYDGQGNAYKDFWQITYDNASGQFVWTQIADFPDSRYGATGVGNHTKGFVGFGYNVSGIQKNDFWEYDPAANQWSIKSAIPSTSRAFAAGFNIGDNIYITTGSGMSDLWKYDPAQNNWTSRNNYPGGGRQGAVAFSIGNKGYVGTGYGPFTTKDFWEYNPVGDSWTRKHDLPGEARGYASGFGIGTKGFIGTGQGVNELADFWEYDPFTNEWLQREDFAGMSRASTAAFSDCKKGYVGTGIGPGSFNHLFAYTPSKVSVGKLQDSVFCTGRNYDIQYTTNESFSFPNVFSVELSDDNGSFSNPVVIGSSSSINLYGTIPVVFPNITTSGTHYRLRITSTQNSATGSDNRYDLTIISVPDPIIWQVGNDLFSTASTGNQWYDTNGPIAGATGQSYTPAVTGDYYVVVSENGCESVPSNSITVITGINEHTVSWMEVNPNPACEFITLKTGKLITSDVTVIITGTAGNKIEELFVSGASLQRGINISLREYATGIYFVKLVSENTTEITRFIKN